MGGSIHTMYCMCVFGVFGILCIWYLVYLRVFDVCLSAMTAAIWRGRLRASGARQFAHPVCGLAGTPHCKIRLQTFRGAGGGTASAPEGESAGPGRLPAPGSAAYRWLALGGQLGQRASRRLDGRRPATASRSSSRVTRPGAGVQGEPRAASSSRLAGLSSVAVWRQTEGWRAALQGIGRKWRTQTQAARKTRLPRIAIDLFTTLSSDTGGTDPAI